MLAKFQNDEYNDDDVKDFLSERFDRLQGLIRNRVGDLLANSGYSSYCSN